MQDLSLRIVETLKVNGPMIGKDITRHLPDVSKLDVWRSIFSNPIFRVSNIANYYLRYDITRKDYVRLSPSILRNFLSFSLIYLPSQQDNAVTHQVNLANFHREISLKKINIAREVFVNALDIVPLHERENICAFIAGDLAYFLGHEEPREVASLGEMVNGSDIDIVIIYDGAPDALIQKINALILQQKAIYLRHPHFRQELDFICKPIEKLHEQFRYDTIHEKIASKIVYEAMFLGGSLALFQTVQRLLIETGAKAKIQNDFNDALQDRHRAVTKLLNVDGDDLDADTTSLFYFTDERLEFQ